MYKIKIVVMGVSGCGKSAIAEKVAEYFGFPYFDGDDYHPNKNIEKMRNGIPLNDEDRSSWLSTLNHLIHENDTLVLACSAITQVYRNQLTAGNSNVKFVYLKGSIDLIWSRLKNREDHYFSGKDMLKSQFEIFVEPIMNEAISIDIDQSIENIVKEAVKNLKALDL
jgi:gluconokinase